MRSRVYETSGGGSNLKVGGGHIASVERESIRAPGQGVTGAKPPEAERLFGIICRNDRQYLPLYPTFESAEICPKHCLEPK